MNDPNFECPKTGEKFFINNYTISISGGEVVFKDKNKDIIKNPNNGEPLKEIDKKIDWNKVNLFIGTGSDSSGVARRNEQLKARSKEHYKKEIREVKYEKNKQLIKKFES